MAELNDMNDEVLPVAVPVIQRRRGRRRRDQEHPAQLHEFAWHAVGGVENDPAGAALELENEILAANLRFEGALANPVSPYLFDLIRQDCTCTVTVLRPGATGCQRIVERCRTHPEETFYQDPRMGRNPLHVACSKNACLHTIESILQANDETNVAVFRDETGNTPLHLLFCGYRTRHMGKTEMLAVMDLLLQPAAASFALRANIAGCLPVHYACSAPESMIHAEAVEKLLVASPECVSRGNNKGQWPLHFHCERRQASTNLARILLQAAPEAALVLDQTQRQGWSPLHYAAWNLNSDLIRFLVATADGNAVASLRSSQTGETALHVLCRRGPTVHQLAAVGALLAAAPDTATQRAAGQKSFTPLHLLCRVRDVPVAIVRAIVEVAPQALRIADDNQYLPLHYACEFGADPEVIACLLEGFPGATKHLTRKNDTALSLACSVNLSGETAQLLLDAHPEALLQKNDYGFNPLHCVCRSYQPKVAIAKAIIDKNPAIVTEQTNAGETAIHLASSSTGGSVGLLEVLTAARVASGAMNVVALDKKVMVNKVGNTPRTFGLFH
jgi:ankyrin repeat protein